MSISMHCKKPLMEVLIPGDERFRKLSNVSVPSFKSWLPALPLSCHVCKSFNAHAVKPMLFCECFLLERKKSI